MNENQDINKILQDSLKAFDKGLEKKKDDIKVDEIGYVKSVDKGVAKITGLKKLKLAEQVRFKNNKLAIVFNLEPKETGVVLLDKTEQIESGDEVYATNTIMSAPVGEGLLGRVIDPLGRILDEQNSLKITQYDPIEKEAFKIMDRKAVTQPLQTGILVIDSLVPVGRGQRELIIGDRQTGKTAIALDTIINQKDNDVICIYCAIGQKSSSVKAVISALEKNNALKRSIIVVATGEDSPGLNYIAPYAATTMGEYFMVQGKDVLIIYDDLTRHAGSYRELSLLLRRPPAREAFPGDIFYIHAKLLERATHLKDSLNGGSLTALPIVETEAQNIAAYIPTNLISITDGQIYLSPSLYQEGQLPAIDIGNSVSRVGGKTQLLAYRSIIKDLKLSYAQFQELELFSRFGTHLEEETKKILNRGKRIREIFKQMEFQPLDVIHQLVLLIGIMNGCFDAILLSDIDAIKSKLAQIPLEQFSFISEKISKNQKLSKEDSDSILSLIKQNMNIQNAKFRENKN